MNQELKFKWHSVYGQVLQDRKLTTAWEKVKANKGAGGIDEVTIETYQRNEAMNIAKLQAKLQKKTYQSFPVKRCYIPKKNNKHKKRPLGIPVIEDRIVQQAVKNVLEPKCEKQLFHRWSCGYRPGRGAERTLQIILWNLETGYNYVYDADIKGFFDNIPHKRLMGVLKKYMSDSTVLNMIWKWLRAGYMEEGKWHRSDDGTPQGGVISPLLANIYLNELDWAYAERGIHFVRYADDFLVFAKTREQLEEAIAITHEKLEELGLEIAKEKTRIVDFREDDFDFIGYTFEHWRKRKKDGKPYFIAKPKESTWKDFRRKIKHKTRKTLTLPKDEWIKQLNPIIRGKVNYFLNLYKAVKANEGYGQKSRCFMNSFGKELKAIDSYTRRRLRVAMIHRNPTQKKGQAMVIRWNNEFFVRIGLVPAFWLYYNKQYGYTLNDYMAYTKKRQKQKHKRAVRNAKARGKEYFTPSRVQKMQNAWNFATN